MKNDNLMIAYIWATIEAGKLQKNMLGNVVVKEEFYVQQNSFKNESERHFHTYGSISGITG